MAASAEVQPPAVLLATSFSEQNRRALRSQEGFWANQGSGKKVFFLPLTSYSFWGRTGFEAAAHATSSSRLTICLEG